MRRVWLCLIAGALAAIFFAASTTAENTGNIMGTVCDSQTGLPIPGARVMIDSTSMGALVNPNDGSYEILNVKPGIYNLVSDCIGYNKITMTGVIVIADSTTIADFKLVAEAVKVGDIIVCATAPTITKEVSSAARISSAQLNSLPVTTIEGVLKSQAGIVSQGGAIHVRGSRAGEIGLVDDGVLIKDQLGGYGGVNIGGSDPNQVSRLSPNPSPQSGGSVNFSTQQYQNAFNTEQYNRIYDNSFLDPRDNPLSTFSIDVDAASYSNVRRFINNGQLPPPDAVRTEEMINYFEYNYRQPDGDSPFSITTDISACPWNINNKLMLIGIQGDKGDRENLAPSNLVFLIDISGSMADNDKLPLIKKAFKMLVRQLNEQDRIAIVVYASTTGLLLPSTPGNCKDRINSAIDQLQADGCTAGGAGMQLAYQTAREYFRKSANNRVIWATDGDFNVGPSSDEEMVRMIEQRRDQGIFLTILGFGEGNLKDSRMEQIADKGNGNYYYIDGIQEANRVFGSQLQGTLFTIAKDVKLQVEFNPARVQAYRLIGYENRLMAEEDFNNDTKDAGEIGCGHSVTALYEIIPSENNCYPPMVDELKYQKPKPEYGYSSSDELLTVKIRYKEPDGKVSKKIEIPVVDKRRPFVSASDNLRFAAAVAEFAMMLRDSQYKGNLTYTQIISTAQNALGYDENGYRHEFVRLVESCQSLEETSQR
jgi:Ca-activated chloride channel homolog